MSMAFLGPNRLTLFKICIALSMVCLCVILLRTDVGVNTDATSRTNGDGGPPKQIDFLERLQLGSSTSNGRNDSSEVNLLFIFTRANEVKFLEQKFSRCLTSLLRRTKTPLHIHVITDLKSLAQAKQVIRFSAFKASSSKIQVDFYNVENIVEPLHDTVSFLQPHFSYKPGAYYSDALFFLSVAIHNVFTQKKLLMIDIDTKFLSDIKDLQSHFDLFQPGSVMGLAYEQQPVYFHLLRDYRLKHKGTKAGGRPMDGDYPGFNSGVMLLNLDRMRNSTLYNSYINATAVDKLAEKYQFKGHLGDQDFFTLLSFEQPQLFYVLPCNWNRQLCQWWKFHGYNEVFDKYYVCEGKVKIFHGNCNSPMPEEEQAENSIEK